jgi:hypothetical protein
MQSRWLLALPMLAMLGCTTVAHRAAAPEPRYLFYLHGAIVEEQGPQGVSPRFGPYDYPGILAAFRERGFTVISEARPKGTNAVAYAGTLAGEVQALLTRGVDPSRITVVGASKGAVIAALASARLGNPRLRYVLLANCNPWLIRTYDPRLTGEVLSIYEASDDIGKSCDEVVRRSPGIARYHEVRLETGLGHGMVYRPLAEWVVPAAEWASR